MNSYGFAASPLLARPLKGAAQGPSKTPRGEINRGVEVTAPVLKHDPAQGPERRVKDATFVDAAPRSIDIRKPDGYMAHAVFKPPERTFEALLDVIPQRLGERDITYTNVNIRHAFLVLPFELMNRRP